MDKYLDAERRLAKLTNYSDLCLELERGSGIDECCWGQMVWVSKVKNRNVDWVVPQWCRDSAATFALMVKYSCYPKSHELSDSILVNKCLEYIDAHADKEAAMRYAIVMAVIQKLEDTKQASTDNALIAT